MDIFSIRAMLRTKSIYDIPLRVTYYARVSSDTDEQLNSLDNQISYYENFIKKNQTWTFVPGYVDEGLSGISTKKRKHFNEMIEDAKKSPEPPVLTKPEVKRLLTNSGMTEEKIADFDKNFDQIAGEKTEFLLTNIAETRKFSIETPDVVIKVKPERTDLVATKIVDGKQCLVIEINDRVEVNGVPVRTITSEE